MKQTLIILCVLVMSSLATLSGITLTVNVVTPGTINESHNLTYEQMRSVTKLVVTGKINAVDFYMIQNYFAYKEIDLSGAAIYAYTGDAGTHLPFDGSIVSYPANTIPENAFKNRSLTSIAFPSTLAAIDKFAFHNCQQLPSITFPGSLVSIGESAFLSCYSLTSISIPENVTSVGESAFAGCWELATVTSLGSITAIPNSMFNACMKLTSVTIPSLVTTIGDAAFVGCSSLASVNIPASVTSFGSSAFSNCSALTSISIPANTTFIGNGAFDNCMAITSVYCYRTVPLFLNENIPYFSVDYTKCTLYVPIGTTDAYLAAQTWTRFYRHIVEITPTAVNSPNANNVSLHFNSATGDLQINGLKGKASLSVHDLNGRFMFKKEIRENETVSLSTLANGIYVLSITSKVGKLERKLIKA